MRVSSILIFLGMARLRHESFRFPSTARPNVIFRMLSRPMTRKSQLTCYFRSNAIIVGRNEQNVMHIYSIEQVYLFLSHLWTAIQLTTARSSAKGVAGDARSPSRLLFIVERLSGSRHKSFLSSSSNSHRFWAFNKVRILSWSDSSIKRPCKTRFLR